MSPESRQTPATPPTPPPASAFERAAWAAALQAADAGVTDMLRVLAVRDVSAVVRAAAAAHTNAPEDAIAAASRDRAPRVRAAALRKLATNPALLASALAREPDARLAADALTLAQTGERSCTALRTLASNLVEHDYALLRAAAARFADPHAVRALLADESSEVRAAAHTALKEANISLSACDVRRVLAMCEGPVLLASFELADMPAFAAAVHAIEIAVASATSMEDANALYAALGTIVRRHPRFSRALDFGRAVEDRLVPAFLMNG